MSRTRTPVDPYGIRRRRAARKRRWSRYSELDLLALLRRRLKGRVEADFLHRSACMFLSFALVAVEHARRNVKAANYEVGRPTTLTPTTRKKRRAARRKPSKR